MNGLTNALCLLFELDLISTVGDVEVLISVGGLIYLVGRGGTAHGKHAITGLLRRWKNIQGVGSNSGGKIRRGCLNPRGNAGSLKACG